MLQSSLGALNMLTKKRVLPAVTVRCGQQASAR